jgi:hypothetical protein
MAAFFDGHLLQDPAIPVANREGVDPFFVFLPFLNLISGYIAPSGPNLKFEMSRTDQAGCAILFRQRKVAMFDGCVVYSGIFSSNGSSFLWLYSLACHLLCCW